MRILKTFALAALIALVATAALTPVEAACGGPRVITTKTTAQASWVWNPGAFGTPACAVGKPPYGYNATPVSPEFEGMCWALGTGNPVVGLGDDVGTFVADGSNTTWTYWTYYPPGSAYPGLSYAAILAIDWAASPTIDGCGPTLTCQCVLLSDQAGGTGYFALLTGQSSLAGDVDLTQPGTGCGENWFGLPTAGDINLAPVPAPEIVRYDMDLDTHNLTFTVNATAPVDGVYIKDGCNCGPTGWVLYEQVLPRGSAAPADRDATANWTAVSAVTEFGLPAVYESACGAAENDVYLAVGLAFADGFPGPTYKLMLSANQGPYECGPSIAEPKTLQPKERRQLREISRPARSR
jgi:hypothetical protein